MFIPFFIHVITPCASLPRSTASARIHNAFCWGCDFVNDSISLRALEERVYLMACVFLLLQTQRVLVYHWVVVIRFDCVGMMMSFGREWVSWVSGRETDGFW